MIDRNLLVFALLIAVFFTSCKETYNPSQYLLANDMDTILVNVITLDYKMPESATLETRHEAQYRQYYVGLLPQFRFINYHVAQDSTHYFYMLRPARSLNNHKRGVFGKYKLGHDLSLIDFEETAVTYVLPEEEIVSKGSKLFENYVSSNIVKVDAEKEFIEWPDGKLGYDKEAKEWRYLVRP